MSVPKTYRANGKLLLTGEYLVLHGAKAIALPLNVGQKMVVSHDDSTQNIRWQAIYSDQIWFSCDLDPVNFSVLDATDSEKAATLVHILQAIRSLNPDFSLAPGIQFKTTIEANPEWGLGSSSTLLSLLSQFAGVDSFLLNELVFQGSGFDIACATADGPIIYQRGRPAEPVSLDYPFAEHLFLIYSGRKKKTAAEVSSFLNGKSVSEQLIEEASNMSREFLLCRDQDEFNLLIRMHEALISKLIGRMALKPMFFADFKGEVKSLGAWGGDFFLASTSKLTFDEVKKYFENKGLMTAFKWNDLMLKR